MNKRGLGRRLLVGCVLIIGFIGLIGCGDHTESVEERMHESSGKTVSSNQTRIISQRWNQRDTIAVDVDEGPPTYVLARTKSIKQYPCGNCHVSKSAVKSNNKQTERAHWNIKINHGSPSSQKSFGCATCHSQDNPATLTTPAGDTVSLNQSQKLCGDCHQKQLRDWKGGAHGKRRSYWQGPRVIYSCAECHNPHDPAIKKRWPVTIPSIPRTYEGTDQ